jgi:hypothetical protein
MAKPISARSRWHAQTAETTPRSRFSPRRVVTARKRQLWHSVLNEAMNCRIFGDLRGGIATALASFAHRLRYPRETNRALVRSRKRAIAARSHVGIRSLAQRCGRGYRSQC